MIYRMARDIAETLASRGLPVAVDYGPDRLTRDLYAPSRIVIERDRTRGDSVEGPMGSSANPRRRRTRQLGVTATIYTSSPVSGARLCEHERECDDIVDALIVAIDEWATAARSSVSYGGGRYLTPDEVSGAERGAGVAYELSLQISRGVYARTRPTAAPADTDTGTIVSLAGAGSEVVP